jgi:hypothetical protein
MSFNSRIHNDLTDRLIEDVRLIISRYQTGQHTIEQIQLIRELMEMGFEKNMIDMCFCFNNITNLEQAIILMTKEDGVWQHNYIPDDNRLCSICGELSDHIDLLISSDNRSSRAREERESLNVRLKSSILSRRSYISGEDSNSSYLVVPTERKEEQVDDNICEICYCNSMDDAFRLSCNHAYCLECWKDYIVTKINNSEVIKPF